MSIEIPKVEYVYFEDLKPKEQIEIASTISDYTSGKLGETPQMLPVSPEEVLAKHSALAALLGQKAIGYVSALEPIEHFGTQMSEVGSLWVDKDYRYHGLGKNLTYLLTHNLLAGGYLPYAFVNPNSHKLFGQSGYVDAWWDVIPPSAFSLCETCPCKPDIGCCDQTMVYTKGVEIGKGFHPSQIPTIGA